MGRPVASFKQLGIFTQTPHALYVPYGNHNLKVLLGDAAKYSVAEFNFFAKYKKFCATFATSASFWDVKKRGKYLCPNPLSEKVWSAIPKAHSCTHSGSKLSSYFSGRLNYIIRYYDKKREYFKLTATDNILIYYKSVWYDL